MPIESGSSSDSQDSFYLSDVSPSDKPWDIHRATASQVGKLYALTDLTRYSERIADCSKRLRFALEASEVGELKHRLDLAKFCRVRHCPVCQWRRSLMWYARFFKAMPKILEQYPTSRFVFLTLTVRSCEITELKKTIAHMHKAWILLTKRKQFPAIGWAKSVEVTRLYDCFHNNNYLGRHGDTWIEKWEKENKGKINKVGSSEAHPHFHCILMVKSSYFTHGYIKQSEWTELWQDCLRIDYPPIVNVKAIKPKPNPTNKESKISGLSIEMVEAICETFKYSIKEDDLTSDSQWLEQLTTQLHKTRAIALGGIFKEYLSEDEPEDLIHTDLSIDDEEVKEEVAKLWFGWREEMKRYRKETLNEP